MLIRPLVVGNKIHSTKLCLFSREGLDLILKQVSFEIEGGQVSNVIKRFSFVTTDSAPM
jgi:hypothetical protein